MPPSEATFNFSFLDALSGIIFCKDLNGKFSYCNKNFADFIGASKDAIINRSTYDFVSKAEADAHQKFDTQLFSSQQAISYEMRHRQPGSEPALFTFSKTILKDNAGNAIGIVGTISHINQQQIHQQLSETRKQLAQSQLQLEEVSHLASLCHWQAHFGHSRIAFSAEFRRILGVPGNDPNPTYRCFLKKLSLQERKKLKQKIQRHLKDKSPFTHEFKIAYQGMIPRIISIQARFKTSKNNRVSIFGTAQDISQKRRTEKELQHFKNIVLSSSDALALVDDNYIYLAANKKSHKVMQRKEGEIVGISIADLMGRDYFEQTIKPLMDRCLNGEDVHYQTHYSWPAIGEVYADIRYAPYYDRNNKIIGAAITGRDITDLKKAEKKLRYYESIVTTSENIIVLADPQLNIMLANEAFKKAFNLEDEVAGLNLTDLIDVDYFSQHISPLCKAWLNNRYIKATLLHAKFPDGLYRQILVRGNSLKDEKGKTTGLIASCQDVTDAEEARDALQSYKHIVSSSRDFMALIGTDYCYQAVNHTYETFFQIPKKAWIGKTRREILGSQYLVNLKSKFDECFQGAIVEFDCEINSPASQEKLWLNYTLSPHINRSGDVAGAVVCARDITQNKQVNMRLRQLSQAVKYSPTAIMMISLEGEIKYANPQFEKMTGYSAEEVIGKSPDFLIHPDTPVNVYASIKMAIAQQKLYTTELYSQKKSGQAFWEKVTYSPVREDNGDILSYLIIREDTTLRKKQESQLLKQAYYDSLTGLPNRLLAKDRLAEAIASAKRNSSLVVLMFIDLDHFKKVNDTMGHEPGDQLLVQTANRLLDCVKDKGSVARLGGDEFIIILPDLDSPTQSNIIVEKILEEVAAPYYLSGKKVYISASIGLTVYPNDGENPDDLMRHADTAMYQSKKLGRNCFHFFQPLMNEEAQRRLTIENHLRHALEREELSLSFQPQHNAYTQKIESVEALLSWENPKLGIVQANEFIAIAEETDLIIPIGEWVLSQAIQQLKSWCDMGIQSIKMSVNISPKQVHRVNFIDTLKNMMQSYKIPSHLLELEVTETLLMDDLPSTRATLLAINQLGVSLAIDDFGTGYSSLSYLKRFPFKTLKIDRTFVRDIAEDEDDLILTKAIIAMAHALHMTVVAEGVESKTQLSLLRAENCDLIQGFYFSFPQSGQEITQLLLDSQTVAEEA